ncbi:MAG: hypothetical protein NTV44_03320, partial [Firmicutes bacterium]|nr:hypothetical protein [Bacillota bacterium]
SSTDMAIRIMSLVTIIVSMVTFSGGIIAYVASWLSSFFDRSEEGTHKLFVYDHILILNWNIKALELIADYASAKGAIDVVVVSEHDRKTIEESIANRLYESKKEGQTNRINVIVIKGNVFSKQVLDRVCLASAKSVIILSDVKGVPSAKGHNADINALKTLMLVTKLSTNPEQTVIVEVTTDETRHLILEQICLDQTDKTRVIPLLSDELMGKLISQILVSPALVQVYSQLMVTDGAEFYPTDQFDPLEFAKTHDHAIPIYQSTNKLYAIAEKHEDIHKVRKEPLTAIPEVKIAARTETRPISLEKKKKNNKLHFILDSMRALEDDCNIKSKVTLIESDDVETIKKSIADIPTIDTILLLSDEHLPKDELDSKVLITLLLIQDIEKLKHANVIVELLDPRHLDIAQSYRIQHTLISNRYISHMMAHISK